MPGPFKLYFALGLCALSWFVTPVVSISCYACTDNPISGESCLHNASVQVCDPNIFDACGTIIVDVIYLNTPITVTSQSCAPSIACNSPIVCDQVNASLNSSGITMLGCNTSCCYNDLCNAAGVGANATQQPPWTNPSWTTSPPWTFPPTTQQPNGSACGAVANNTLKSPNYPNEYPRMLDCNNIVHIPYGMAMKIYFNDFYVEDASSCQYDYLEITNEQNQNFGKFCGAQTGSVVTVTGQYVNLTFHSDSTIQWRGFLLRFIGVPNGNATQPPWTNPPWTTYPPWTTNPPWNYTYPPWTTSPPWNYTYPPWTTTPPWTLPTTHQPSSRCGAVANNTLKSPNYPNGYPHMLDCNYIVHIPYGMAMKIYFNDFYMEYASSCQYDYLEITNDLNQNYGKFCGVQTGSVVTVTGQYVNLTFHSDFMIHRRGFLLTFSSVPNGGNATQPPWTNPPWTTYPPWTTNPPWNYTYPPWTTSPPWNYTYPPWTTNPPWTLPTTQQPSNGCNALTNNTLKSPNYPGYYPNNMDCNYSVYIPHGKTMKINFVDFELEWASNCQYDYLEITNEQNQLFGKFCGVKTGSFVLATGHYVKLHFHSDFMVSRRGFFLTFIATSMGNVTFPNTTAPWTPWTTYPPWTSPTGYHTSRPTSVQSLLRQGIYHLRMIINQMEYIIDYQLGHNCKRSALTVKYKALVKKAVDDVHMAMKREGRVKRDLIKTRIVNRMEKKAAELIRKMETQQGVNGKPFAEAEQKQKREAKDQPFAKEKLFNIKETVAKMNENHRKGIDETRAMDAMMNQKSAFKGHHFVEEKLANIKNIVVKMTGKERKGA